jgi:hypothetical protein
VIASPARGGGRAAGCLFEDRRLEGSLSVCVEEYSSFCKPKMENYKCE